MSLFRNTIQYGYILMRRGNFDTSVYDLIAKAVSIQIDESFEYSMKLKSKVSKSESYKIVNEVTHFDYLTGLKNEKGFYELGDTSLKYAQAMAQNGLLVSFDIKGLGKINTQFGHTAGDEAIKAFGELLKENFRSNDIVARIGGDNFFVISSGFSVDNYKNICEKIADSCYKWKETGARPFEINFTSSFVIFPSLKYGYDLQGLMGKLGQTIAKQKS